MISVEQVSIKYIKEYFSLYNINLKIDSNTLLLGDETSGNNFLLRLLAKIDKHYSGNIFVDKQNLKLIKDKNLDMAYLPKTPCLFENKTLLENLIYPLKIRKIAKKDAILRVKTAIEPYFLKIFKIYNKLNENNNLNKTEKLEIELNEFLKTKIKNFDVFTKKIVALIRAGIRKPKYLLMENFFEELDATYFDLASEIISNFFNSSIIIATQNENLQIPAFKNFKQIVFDAGIIK